jgi:two-component system, chemotaxis family, response regulator WspF
MRLALVNDMPIALESLRRIVSSEPGLQIAWSASDGAEAVAACARDLPDLILMDLLMPVMDGVEATRRIMASTPCPILLVTSSVDTNFAKVFDALGHGALDAIDTPGPREGAALLEKIRRIQRLTSAVTPRSGTFSAIKPASESGNPLVVIGSSTGGPQALEKILAALPKDLPASVVIVQHLDSHFAAGLRDWLATRTPIKVELAQAGLKPESGTVYLAKTNDHLILTPACTFSYVTEPADYPYRPSVDVFFRSVRANIKSRGVGVLLTGMGSDGARGLLELRQAGWQTLAQDQPTSIVYGMPKAAKELGAACEVLPLDQIARSILRALPLRPASGLISPRKGATHG